MPLLSPLLAAHIAAGAVAVPLGAAALVARKGVRTHARAGKLYYSAMAVVIGSAAVLTAARREPYLAGLTAAAAIATISGCRVLGRKRPDLDPAQRASDKADAIEPRRRIAPAEEERRAEKRLSRVGEFLRAHRGIG